MPPNQSPLFLHEEIMLLALRDEKGTVEFGSMYNYASAGAILGDAPRHGHGLRFASRLALDWELR